MKFRHRFLGARATSLLLLSAAAASLLAGDAQTSTPVGQERARVLLESLEGEVRARPLAGFETADPRSLGATLLRFEGLERPPLPAPDRERGLLTLVDGGRVHVRLRGGEAEALSLELLTGAPLQLSIEALSSLVFPGRVPEDWTEPLEAARVGDRLYLYRPAGLDRIDGAVESFSAQGVRFGSSLGARLFPWGEVSGLFIEALGEEDAGATPGAVVVTLDLIDGSRLGGELVKLDERECRLRMSGGSLLRLPLGVVSELVVDDERLAFLSDLPPAFAEDASPFGDDLGMRWPHQRDRSVSGGPLRAGGMLWTRGIGVHAPSRLGWKLDGAWSSLRGKVAIDDEVLNLAARGSVRFRVLADGELRWESPLMRGGDAPLEMPVIALEGVDELVLEVDRATDLHIADRADWLRLVLRR